MVKGLQVEWGICSCTVSLNHLPQALACWKDTIAVGFGYMFVARSIPSNIIILDAITGVHTSVITGHTAGVNSLTFSLDGMLLVSGGMGSLVKLWDIQTGGVIRTFCGHTGAVYSVSISPDNTTVASGSQDTRIHLWGTWTGECHHVINGHDLAINSVSFSPTNSQLLISASGDNTIKQWDIGGSQIGPTYSGDHVVFSPDGTHFVLWEENKGVATVQSSNSGVTVANLQAPNQYLCYCCFSPDAKFIAGSTSHNICIWDITSSAPHLVKTFVGHYEVITSIAFSSSLISTSGDRLVKFWQISPSSTDPGGTDSEPTLLDLAPIQAVKLQTIDGIAISIDSDRVVKTWDIVTGFCKASFHFPATVQHFVVCDMQLVDGRFVVVGHQATGMFIWDIREEVLQTVDIGLDDQVARPRISGDRSKAFFCYHDKILASSTWTGEIVGEVRFQGEPFYYPLTVDGSRIWVHLKGFQTQGWDFGIPGSPIMLPDMHLPRPCLDFVNGTKRFPTSLSWVQDTVTGKEVFWLSPERYEQPADVAWDGQYLIAGYASGEVLILDFVHMIPSSGLYIL